MADAGRYSGIMWNLPETQQSSANERTTRVVKAAIQLFTDGTRAANWARTPSLEFAGRSPLEVAMENENGCRAVCALLEEYKQRWPSPPPQRTA